MSKSTAKAEIAKRSAHLINAICYLETIPDDELLDMLKHCQSLTTTNCGWSEYALAPLLIKEIQITMAIRKANAEPDTIGDKP
jgi:hypothetical protein